MENKTKLIVILGPTASGKTKLAVDLARLFDGEIVSADSRQVYRGMDIGTGKDLQEYGDVKYHLIDVADPRDQFSAADFKRQADRAIEEIASRGKVPMLVGGSGLYLQAVVDNFSMEDNGGADERLRAELEGKSTLELFAMLRKNNQFFADALNNSDKNNKRRLVRYVELSLSSKTKTATKLEPKYSSLVLGLMPDKELMEGKIKKRLIERLEKEEMVNEVEGLRRQGLTDKRLKDFGLEYKFITEYLEEKYGYDEMVERLFIAIRQFAKRQITWFKRWEKQGKLINWITSQAEARELIEKFLRNN
jgi:tRNA dimethylallyltransferase